MHDLVGGDWTSMARPDLPRCLAVVGSVIGGLVLVGWELDLEILTRLVPGLISMKPNAAMGFLLAGASLWTLQGSARSRRISLGLAAVVGVIGGLTLFEYASGIGLGIDEILARERPNSIGSISTSRMHPTTAFDFVLLALALAMLGTDRWHRTAQALALVAALIAGSALIGYIYGVREFVGVAAFNQMALHTSVGMLVLAAGILLVRPDRGLMGPITADTAGGLMARRLLPVALAVPVILNGLALMAQRSGYFDDIFGAAVRAVLAVAVFFAFIGRAAHLLHRMDLERRGVSAGLRSAHGELEARIAIHAAVEMELRASEQRYRFLANAMPQIFWTALPDGEVDYLNHRWYEYTGTSVDQVSGWDWKSVVHPDDLPNSIDRWTRSLRSGEAYEVEYRFRRGDGAYRWHLGRAVPMRDESGSILRWIWTSTDIDDYKLAEEDLQEARDRLEQRVSDRTAELASANKGLKRGELRYRLLVEATTAIVWNTPASGEFASEQPGWSDFTGQSFDQLKGWGWLDAVHPDDRPHTAQAWSTAVASRSIYRVEHRLRRHDGEYRHMLVRAVPILSEDGEIGEWVGVHTDVDEQVRAKEAMRVGKEAAEAATRAKSEFLANMSHEIRTPMNGILGMTELALDTELTPQQREYLCLVKSSADALLIVINDILDFSKIEAGKLDLDPVQFGLRGCVEGTLKILALRAHGKGLELSCRFAPDIPDNLRGDSGRLQQILVNLVGNAIKFTEQGEVVVTVEAMDPEPGSEDLTLHLSVSDTGIGIPACKLHAILEPFTQADGSTTRKYGGTGLGLAISCKLVELMGGRLWVESEPGRGSTFHFTANLRPQPGTPADPVKADRQRLRHLPILVVDDNQTNRRILHEVLANWGARPTSVDSGAAALTMLSAARAAGQPFPVVLLDGIMPGMDGSAVAERIADDPNLADTQVVLLTSSDRRARGAGRSPDPRIAARLTKPIRQSELFDLLMRLLSSGPDHALPVSTAAQPVPERTPSPTSRRLKILLAEDNFVNQKVVTSMLTKRGHAVTVAPDGRRALEAQANTPFDLILMDLHMPEMDGFETLDAIRLDERSTGRYLPIIALTADAMKGDKERCLAHGFDAYLSKPIQSELMFATIDELLGASPATSDSLPAPATPDANAHAIFDREAALHSTGGDEAIFGEILDMFLNECPHLLDEIRNAIEADDNSALRLVAHKLKGMAGQFAAPGVIAAVSQLEILGRSESCARADDALRTLVSALDQFFDALGELAPPVAPWHAGAVILNSH